MTRSVVLPFSRPGREEIRAFVKRKDALANELRRHCFYRDIVALRYEFRFGGDAERVRKKIGKLFSGVFCGTWTRLWHVYEPTLSFTYFVSSLLLLIKPRVYESIEF